MILRATRAWKARRRLLRPRRPLPTPHRQAPRAARGGGWRKVLVEEGGVRIGWRKAVVGVGRERDVRELIRSLREGDR